jgi:hypothetical protein
MLRVSTVPRWEYTPVLTRPVLVSKSTTHSRRIHKVLPRGYAGVRRPVQARELSTLLRPRRSSATWENGLPHNGSWGVADTEEDGGSTPPAPTIPTLSRAFEA